jgi:hypothetical protein
MNPCQDCYAVQFTSCNSSEVELNLLADTTYFVWIYDRFNNIYVKEVETDGDGAFELDADDFPEGLFVNGSITGYISDNDNTNTKEGFTVGGVDYDCFLLTIFTNGNRFNYLFTEDNDEIITEGGQSIIT